MATFFTSDTHFGDHRTINIHRRRFASVAEMDAVLVDQWNAVVGEDDEVWHLGDFARSLRDAERVMGVLRGRKHLIRGNNDPEAVAAHPGWASVPTITSFASASGSSSSAIIPFVPGTGRRAGR